MSRLGKLGAAVSLAGVVIGYRAVDYLAVTAGAQSAYPRRRSRKVAT